MFVVMRFIASMRKSYQLKGYRFMSHQPSVHDCKMTGIVQTTINRQLS